MKKVIGIDLMGSDQPPVIFLDAIGRLIPSLPSNIGLAIIATAEHAKRASFLPFYPALEVIEMQESPLLALRQKKQCSTLVGMRLLKEGKIDAFVSAGNTGALVSAAKMILGMFPSLHRAALLALMPTKNQPVAVLDVGANLRQKASHLVQWARLGSAYQKIQGRNIPRVALLNIGSEPVKGTSEIQLAYQMLKNLKNPPFHFVGNVEGRAVFNGEIDILIADGFTGNVFLKTAEGLASFILDQMDGSIALKQGSINELRNRLYHTEYPGALLAGVKGIVIKCHGHATADSLLRGIQGAIEFASHSFASQLQDQFVKKF